jgi:hypothetical protein
VPLALCVQWGVERLGRAIREKHGRPRSFAGRAGLAAAMYGLILLPTAPPFLMGASSAQPVRADIRQMLRWLETQPTVEGREGVLGPWQLGHAIQYYAGRAVVVSPFGTEAGDHAMEDWATFLMARDEADAQRLLQRRRIGFVLLANPVFDWQALQLLAPPGSPEVVRLTPRVLEGPLVEILPGVEQLVTARMYFFDGGGRDGWPAIGTFRLVGEAGTGGSEDPLRDSRVQLYEPVVGARLEVAGAPPLCRVWARSRVRTAEGREFTHETWRDADGNGSSFLTVPYATGRNGTSIATAYLLDACGMTGTTNVGEGDVLAGRRLRIDVAAPGR